ncbi:MAG: hypothetical protein R3B13_32525 [Polyangiaceae bacterium]
MNELENDVASDIAVFRHERRDEWGLGVLATQADNHRAYVFEYGGIRVIAEPYYPLVHEVDSPVDELAALMKRLGPDLAAARKGSEIVARSTRSSASAMTFDDQLRVFRDSYPEGFEDARWLSERRGRGARKQARSHREATLASAQKQFSKRPFKARLTAEAFDELHADLCALLKATDLVPGVEVSAFARSNPAERRALVLATFEVLHGSGPPTRRIECFVAELERVTASLAGWQLVTTLLGLVSPAEHVSVQPAAFRAQARWMAPRMIVPKYPSGASYSRCLSMAKVVRTRLVDYAEQPADLMDVLDFIRLTTSTAARQHLREMKVVAT